MACKVARRSLCGIALNSIDLDCDLLIVFRSTGTHDYTNCLCNASLLANDASGILRCNVQMINDHAFFIGCIFCDLNGSRVFHQTGNDHFQQLLHVSYLLVNNS